MRLRIDKHFNAIFAGESFSQTLFVIPHSLHQIRCYADLQCAVSSACHDVDKELFCHAGPLFLDSTPRLRKCNIITFTLMGDLDVSHSSIPHGIGRG